MVRLLQTPLATATALLLALAGVAPSHALSISSPTRDYDASDRAAAIVEAASQVVNGPRNMTIGGETFPLFYGPLLPPGSVMDQLELKEDARVDELGSALPKLLLGLVANLSAELTSIDGYNKLYNTLEGYIEWPMSSDNRDETFGEQRLTVKSSALRKATLDDLGDDTLALPEHKLLEICGRDAEQLYDDGLLFVEDYHDAATYNDPKRPDKYVPNVVGFFCATPDTLLPIEIRLLDTNVTYTPADSEAEWTLAKMALEVGSATYHQWQHLVETHAVLIPLRVEAMRTMSAEHPVRALLQRHSQVDFGLEYRTVHHLLAENESLAQIIGWGASGSARFTLAQFARGASVQHKEFHADVARRGLDKIRGHKYVQYGTLYEKAIRAFVKAFVDVYYAQGDATVADDLELQHWAAASARIPHVPDFPTAIDTKDQLRRLLTHLVFTSTVRHHSMSGQVTWHGHSSPFAPAALWKPLPTAKLAPGESLDVLAYAAPPKVVPLAVAVTSVFYRNVTEDQSILSAYKVAPFASEKALQPAIAAFGRALDRIEQTIATNEADCEWPYRALLPSNMPHHSWI